MYQPEDIYKNYSVKVFNLAYRMTGNKDDAHDITQETFIQAFKTIDKFKGESHIYTWLYRIAKNNCLQFLNKKNKSSFSSLQELTEKASSPVPEELSENEKTSYISQVKDGCLSGLLRCLSLQQRLVFILHVLLDVSIEQVANIIEKSENATRILVHRSRQNIKNFLCTNCSLYNPPNPCRCENLVNFSLKQGWLETNTEEFINTEQIEAEIVNLKDVVSLYKSLQDKIPAKDFNQRLQQLLTEKQDFLIFNDKKVK